MKYLLMIYSNETQMAQLTPEQQGKQWAAYIAFTAEVNKSGLFSAGEALQSTATATTVRQQGGRAVTTDGPFAETKEQLTGYYLLNCKDLDQAIEYAAKITAIDGSAVEIRPIMEIM